MVEKNNHGFWPSPYLVIKNMLIVEDRVRGALFNPKNVFRWNKVILNLPGMADYDSSKPWAFKVRKDKTLAADLFFYIDDRIPTNPSTWECWCASRKICYTLIWYGFKILEGKEWRQVRFLLNGLTLVETVDGKATLLMSKKVGWSEAISCGHYHHLLQMKR